MKVKAKNIIRNIFLKTGDLYQDDQFIKTNVQLRSFDIFKGVNIRRLVNADNPEILDFVIELSQKKRMVFGADLELNNSNIVATSRISLLGIAGSINFRHRNLFKNAYLFLGEIQGGVDMNLSDRANLFYSSDITAKFDLYMPRFVDPVNIWKGMRKLKFIKGGFYQDLKEKGRTLLSASYNNLSLFQFYSYHSTNLSYGYDLQRNASNRYQINQVGINYLATSTQPAFEDVLKDNPFLANSFSDQLFTGLLFKDFTYTYVGKQNRFGRSFFFQAIAELSGTEMWAANKLYNGLAGNTDTLKLFDRIEFAQFASLSIDGRFYKNISKSQSFAARFTAGIAKAFGYSEEVPYIKQFYVGGPYSVRAWAIRELGPGEYFDPSFDPPGQYSFLSNGRLQNGIQRRISFRCFLDVGVCFIFRCWNVWTLGEDPSRPGSQLLWQPKLVDGVPVGDNLFEQMAIGTGIGFRGDFSYFIIRLDLGFKLRNPYEDPVTGKHWRWDRTATNAI